MRAQTPIGTLVVALISGVLHAEGQEPPPTFRSGADVVVLDVVATDAKGRPFTELRKEDLQVSEDGQACAILSLRLVRATSEPSPAPKPAPPPAASAGTAPAPAPATPSRPSLVVLVFDRLTTPFAPLARKGALELTTRAFPPDTWFAVFKVGYGTRLLSPFTTDAAQLRSSIEAATMGDPDTRGSRAPGLPPVKVQAEQPSDQGDRNRPLIPDLRPVAEAVAGEELLLARRNEGYDSLYAVMGIARALAAVEGRKSVVYFAEGWHLPTGTQQVYDDAVSAANRANVAVHTVDARGLTSHKPMGLTPIDSVLDRFTADHREGAGPGASTPPIEAAGGLAPGNGPMTRGAEHREEQLTGPTLQRLADDTGGLAIADTNDVGAGLAAVAEELHQYYEIVYAPANPVADGRFRRIGVKVSRQGVHLRTRAGYFATPSHAPTLAAYELPLMRALGSEAPARDFALQAGVLQFGPKGRGRECVVLAEVPLAQVQIAADPANDAYRGHLSLLAYVKDESGRVLARLSHDWPIDGPLEAREAARTRSALFRRTLSLPPGRYVLSVAVQDRRSSGTSVARTPFEVQPTGSGLSLGSITLLERASPSAGTAADDPLSVGGVSLVPRLSAFTAGSSAELPIFAPVYPARDAGRVELSVELRREGAVVAEATPELPSADATGRIPWLGAIPAAGLRPGEYEITVTAKQAGVTAFDHARLSVVGGRQADVRPAKTSKPPDAALAALLERAARYVVEYENRFRNLVAEERYTQKASGTGQGFTATATAPVHLSDGSQLQTTRADLAFVHLAGDVPWGVFRDVFEVNGNKVRDRDERLEKLFRAAAPSALEQAGRILAESARYNIGPRRTVNLPTLALVFLHPRNQPRFSFEAGGRRRFGDYEGVEVSFVEQDRPTITSDLEGGSVPVSGRFWIDATRGAILRSETRYHFEPQRATGFIATEYRLEPRLGLWVPGEMTERYEDRPATPDPVFRHPAEASARYSNFRQFTVSTEEKAALPPEP